MNIIYALTFSLFLFLVSYANADNTGCIKDNNTYELCGTWQEKEILEIMPLYTGKEEIHKLIKQKENYYILHTCGSRTESNICMGGYVYIFERIDGELKVKPERWNWSF